MKNYLFVLTLFSLTSCATIKNGKYQQVAINSDPQGANVWVNHHPMGTTPLCANLKRSDSHHVRIELPGYKPYETQLYPTVSGWVFGNLLIGGLIGIAVDATTGSMYKLTPDQLTACLISDQVITTMKEGDCQVVVMSKTDLDVEPIGALERS